MTKTEFRNRLYLVVLAVLTAEKNVNLRDTELIDKLRTGKVPVEDYCYLLTDEVISIMPKEYMAEIIDK